MKAILGFRTVQTLAVLIAIGLVAAGCASTKNVMNKASFGLIGGSEKADDAAAGAQEDSKEARKAREKEEKQQREAEKRAAKDDEKARKAAANEEKSNEDKPGLMSRMTFGLAGGDKKSDDEKQQEAAEHEQKRQDEEAREQEKSDAKAAKREQKQEEDAHKQEEKLAATERKEQEKEAEKSEAQTASTEESAGEETSGKRSLMSRMTFGLVGGKKSDESDTSEQSDQTAASTESAEPASDDASKEEKKAQKRAEKEQREAEKEQEKQADVASNQAEAGAPDAEPDEKRTLMSRMTFGLVGGKKSDKSDQSEQSDSSDKSAPTTSSTESTASTNSEQPALPPEQLAMAAPTDAQYDVQPASALDGEAQKLAKMPFKSTFDLSTKSASGKGQATASRESYSKNGYGITDLGDVRIAVQGMTFDGESRAGGIVISSDDRAAVGGKSGVGNNAFIYEYAKGVTAVQFGTVNFTIAKSVISIGGKSVPIGQGKKLIVVDGQGNVIGAYSAE